MTTRYRVEYALKHHRRDNFIEWIKGLLAVPFVLHSLPSTPLSISKEDMNIKTADARRRYLEILRDVQDLINEDIAQIAAGTKKKSRLKLLVPTIGHFFTPLPLEQAFLDVDNQRSISGRRNVAPSFNDVRFILAYAQLLQLARDGVKLITFDGDLTLYQDGLDLTPDSPVVGRLVELLRLDIHVAILTAAGYSDKNGYKKRLYGLFDGLRDCQLTNDQKRNLAVLGGESNYLFRYDPIQNDLVGVEEEEWMLDEMKHWKSEDIQTFLDIAQKVLEQSVNSMKLSADVVRKDRAVGLVPRGRRFQREQLEEVVLAAHRELSASEVSERITFCAFNGGSDVWIDLGDKRLGVLCLQKWLGRGSPIEGKQTLHVGDQFLSLGSNDFITRRAATTVWIQGPEETCELMDQLLFYLCKKC